MPEPSAVRDREPPGAPRHWVHRSGAVELDEPVLMGILNVTTDSFSDGGLYLDPGRAVEQAERMVDEGADLIDVGGESTRPGAAPIAPDLERARVAAIVRRLRPRIKVPISVDTRRAVVAREAIDAGADIVNDVSALADPAMASTAASAGVGVVLMHMRGTPQTMQEDPRYDDVLTEVADALRSRLTYAVHEGIDRERIVLDPGIGFGKTIDHNLQLIAGLGVLTEIGRPVLLGVSRKAFLGDLIGGAPPAERSVATAAACVVGLLHGARLFRVHDVKPVREALRVAEAIRRAVLPTN